MVGLLALLGRYVGLAGVVKLYFVPYLVMNHWFVLITYLQVINNPRLDFRAS